MLTENLVYKNCPADGNSRVQAAQFWSCIATEEEKNPFLSYLKTRFAHFPLSLFRHQPLCDHADNQIASWSSHLRERDPSPVIPCCLHWTQKLGNICLTPYTWKCSPNCSSISTENKMYNLELRATR